VTPCLRVQLSPREREIAELIGDGESYQQIATALRISINSVRSYVNRIACKVDIDGERALEPRFQVFVLVMHERWSKRKAS
jgi:DNA-binding CsgD family transcriptional regulator